MVSFSQSTHRYGQLWKAASGVRLFKYTYLRKTMTIKTIVLPPVTLPLRVSTNHGIIGKLPKN